MRDSRCEARSVPAIFYSQSSILATSRKFIQRGENENDGFIGLYHVNFFMVVAQPTIVSLFGAHSPLEPLS